jgi:hypothetical protein
MLRRTKIIVGGLTVALALAAAVNTATARRIEVSEQRFLILFSALTLEAGGNQFVCPLTMEGSFHSRTISKVSGQLVGYVTEAIFQHPCRTNELWALNGIERIQGATAPNTLPWHILYINFRGVLPNITEIELKFIAHGFRTEIAGILCLYRIPASVTKWAEYQVKVEAGRITGIRFNEERRIPLFESQSGAFCPVEFVMAGEGIVATQGVHRAITVRLIQ